ncbi:hypothetical protein E3P89_00351 [Wallemia ichthyophaga]|uniref:Uncharacterized protein n=1 Tax=Wallemia ichthyophaga TaxID=245174 RepID=A0A4T0IC49_WALIC|nr:hypothetical protein E3P98_00366 [Wallemia ichthyophaga]TIB16349.1 hypothetical protein E3P90_00510 [Wallemia ichthyophaga]TIB18079.1 hypothetical protein E3P93_00367 [Wallemia ichthyophaga]TIB25744.1 hypothetical protein E3P89_00351 [Wallemia ichthyophaga]TIB27148.1 hypothetical protein E3P88_00379 [Wallemia ichthyophaga]
MLHSLFLNDDFDRHCSFVAGVASRIRSEFDGCYVAPDSNTNQTIPLVQVLDDRFQYNIGSSVDHLRKLISASTTPILESPPSVSIKEANSATLLIDLVRVGYYYARIYKYNLVSLLYQQNQDKLGDLLQKTRFQHVLLVSALLWLLSTAGFLFHMLNKPISTTNVDMQSTNPSEWQLDNKSTDYSKLLVPESNTGTTSNKSSVRSAKSSPRSPLNQQDNALGLDIDKSELPVQSTITKSHLAEASFGADQDGQDEFNTPASDNMVLLDEEICKERSSLPDEQVHLKTTKLLAGEVHMEKSILPNEQLFVNEISPQGEQLHFETTKVPPVEGIVVDRVDIDNTEASAMYKQKVEDDHVGKASKLQTSPHTAKENGTSSRSPQAHLHTKLESEILPATQTLTQVHTSETAPSIKSNKSSKSKASQKAKDIAKSISRAPSRVTRSGFNKADAISGVSNHSDDRKSSFSHDDDLTSGSSQLASKRML